MKKNLKAPKSKILKIVNLRWPIKIDLLLKTTTLGKSIGLKIDINIPDYF
jgi:hypothetical protein